MQFAIHTALWVDRWGEDLRPHLRRAQALGFDAAEVSLLGIDGDMADDVHAEAASLGMEVRCTTGLGASTDPSSADPTVRRAALDALTQAIELTRRCGAQVLTGVTHSGWGVARAEDRTEAAARSAATLADLVGALDDAEITLGIEAVNRFESDVVNTAEDAVALCEAVGSPQIGVHLDTFHMNIEESSFREACAVAGDRLVHLHAVDHDRGAPRAGRIPWDELAAGLRSVGYDGWVGLELFVRAGAPSSADLRIWRDIEPDADEAATTGLAFVRSVLT